jgi:hypothetical protein
MSGVLSGLDECALVCVLAFPAGRANWRVGDRELLLPNTVDFAVCAWYVLGKGVPV